MKKPIVLLVITVLSVIFMCSIPVFAAKKTVIVNTKEELFEAMKKKNVSTIKFVCDRSIKITIKATGTSKKKKLIIDAPKVTIINKARFKSITVVSAKEYIENTKGNTISIESKDIPFSYGAMGKKGKGKVTITGDEWSIKTDVSPTPTPTPLPIVSKLDITDFESKSDGYSLACKAEDNSEISSSISFTDVKCLDVQTQLKDSYLYMINYIANAKFNESYYVDSITYKFTYDIYDENENIVTSGDFRIVKIKNNTKYQSGIEVYVPKNTECSFLKIIVTPESATANKSNQPLPLNLDLSEILDRSYYYSISDNSGTEYKTKLTFSNISYEAEKEKSYEDSYYFQLKYTASSTYYDNSATTSKHFRYYVTIMIYNKEGDFIRSFSGYVADMLGDETTSSLTMRFGIEKKYGREFIIKTSEDYVKLMP